MLNVTVFTEVREKIGDLGGRVVEGEVVISRQIGVKGLSRFYGLRTPLHQAVSNGELPDAEGSRATHGGSQEHNRDCFARIGHGTAFYSLDGRCTCQPLRCRLITTAYSGILRLFNCPVCKAASIEPAGPLAPLFCCIIKRLGAFSEGKSALKLAPLASL